LYVFVALCVLTSASFFTYSSYWPWHHVPAVGWTFMMAVSCTKAMLVILFFMHVKYEASWKYVLTIPASVMAIFLMLALIPDVGRRYNTVLGGRTVAEERLEHMAEPRDVQAIEAAEEEHH
jgi:cytochrome c oxidase subunit 4